MTNTKKLWLSAGFIVFLILLYCLKPILGPFLASALIAYLSNPLIERIEKLKVPRTAAVTIVFILLLSIVFILLFLLIPLLERQIMLLVKKMPVFIAWIQQIVVPWLNQHFDFNIELNFKGMRELISGHWDQAGNVVNIVWKTVSHSSYTLFVFLLNLVLIPVLTFYFMRDWHDLIDGIRTLIPRSVEPLVVRLANECNEVIGAFFRGQLLVMLALGIFYVVGLNIAGLELSLLIGIIVAILSIVPYLGFTIGILLSIVAALVQYQDWIHLLYVVIVFAVGHVAENYILTPMLVGDKIGLHPAAVIFAILAGGELFGFVGVLLALPVAAVIMVLIRYAKEQYTHSHLYLHKMKES